MGCFQTKVVYADNRDGNELGGDMTNQFEDRSAPRASGEGEHAPSDVKLTPQAGRGAFWRLLGFDGPIPDWLDKSLFQSTPQSLLDENTEPAVDDEAREFIRRCVRMEATGDEQDKLRHLARSYMSWRDALAAAYREEDDRAEGEYVGGL
jgi:hypothetical protein